MKRFGFIILVVAFVCTTMPLTCLAEGKNFTDVPADAWYYNDVQNAVEKGLIDGKTATTYAPEDNLTYAEAVKLAACMHKLSTDGNIDFEQSSPWYMTFVEYAKANNIISKDYDWDKKATRAEYMDIFSKALPSEKLNDVNRVPDNTIPDVPVTHPYAASIYKMYRAGIVQGSDAQYSCKPSENITRSEVAAILTRMMDANSRKNFTITIPEYSTLYNTGYALYDAKINEYYQAMDADDNTFDAGDWSSINNLMVHYARDGYGEPGTLYYALYDIDKNGVPELIFSNKTDFIDVYTLNSDNLVKIFKECCFGYRERLHILSDGTLLTEGSFSAFGSGCNILKLKQDGSLESIGAYYCDTNGPDAYMKGYTYISTNEYVDKVSNYISYSLINSLDWELFADMKVITQKSHYNTALIALSSGNYLFAAEQFLEAGDYQDAETMVLECYYLYGKNQMELNYVTEGLEYLSKCRGYKDTDEIVLGYYYDKAMAAFGHWLDSFTAGESWNGDKYYENAISMLEKCENYKDSQDVLTAMKKIDEAVSVLFGNVRTIVDGHMTGSDISFKNGVITFDIPAFADYVGVECSLLLKYNMNEKTFVASLDNMYGYEKITSKRNTEMMKSLLVLFTDLKKLDDFVSLYSDTDNWNSSGTVSTFSVDYGGYAINIDAALENNRLSWSISAGR